MHSLLTLAFTVRATRLFANFSSSARANRFVFNQNSIPRQKERNPLANSTKNLACLSLFWRQFELELKLTESVWSVRVCVWPERCSGCLKLIKLRQHPRCLVVAVAFELTLSFSIKILMINFPFGEDDRAG